MELFYEEPTEEAPAPSTDIPPFCWSAFDYDGVLLFYFFINNKTNILNFQLR